VLLAGFAGVALLDRIFRPLTGWFLEWRLNRVIDRVNRHLKVRIEPFKATPRAKLVERLCNDPQVLAALEAHAAATGLSRGKAEAIVRRYAKEIVPSFNADVYFRFGTWIADNTARVLFRVRVGYSDDGALGRVDPGSSIVFVMNHRSNMDYVLVAYLVSERTALSYAVGEWARIWPLQQLIRAMGAYFIRRNSRDPLYRKVVERYVQMATEAGVVQAIFPEGGLTKDGLLGAPKLGLLDYMLRTFDSKGRRDLVFIPVGINYDRVFEDRTQLAALAPEATSRSRAYAAWKAVAFVARNLGQMATHRWYRFGYACVNFGAPVSMRAWVERERIDFAVLSKEERAPAVERLAGHLMGEVGRVVPVLPVALVATVLLRRDGRPASDIEIKADVLALMRALEAKDAHVYVPRADQGYAVDVGLRMLTLRNVVDAKDGLFVVREGERRLLAYYANSIAHLVGGLAGPAPAGPT
jgi:glycerol-3-phosphate O-acyltransferase